MFKQNIEDIKDWLNNPFKLNYFTYIFRRPYYRWQLFKRFLKYPMYGDWELTEEIFNYSFEILCHFFENYSDKIKYRWDIDKANEYEKGMLISQNKDNEEIEFLYNWYTVERPRREDELEYLLHVWSEHHVSWWARCQDVDDHNRGCLQYYVNPRNDYADYLHNMLNEEETKFDIEMEEMLIRLVKIRRRLWD